MLYFLFDYIVFLNQKYCLTKKIENQKTITGQGAEMKIRYVLCVLLCNFVSCVVAVDNTRSEIQRNCGTTPSTPKRKQLTCGCYQSSVDELGGLFEGLHSQEKCAACPTSPDRDACPTSPPTPKRNAQCPTSPDKRNVSSLLARYCMGFQGLRFDSLLSR